MKMVKSLLLGSAAGFVAVVSAQAADMPVKAKPVQYVKICTLYGDGFYYIPGTDTCIRVFGQIRASYGFGVSRGAQTPIYSGGSGGSRDITTNEYSTRHRFSLGIDTRTQTAYGTLRTVGSIDMDNENLDTPNNEIDRAMIQWAGFTFGRTQSYADQFDVGSSWRFGQTQNHASTSASGINQLDYAIQLGGGLRLHLGINERNRNKSLSNLSSGGTLRIGAEPTSSRAGHRWPDLYAALKYAGEGVEMGVSFMAHDNRTTYHSGAGCPAGAQPGTSQCMYSEKIGWAMLTGIEVKLPMIAPGDRFGAYFNYAQGFGSVGGGNNLSSPALFGVGNEVAFGFITDGVFINGSGIELTTTWSVGAAYEHYWSPIFRSSFYGMYTQVSYNTTATGYICGATPSNITIPTNCDPNWVYWQVGSRTLWEPVRRFILGIDVFWTQIETGFNGGTFAINNPTTNIIGARPTGTYRLTDQGNASIVFRAQRSY